MTDKEKIITLVAVAITAAILHCPTACGAALIAIIVDVFFFMGSES